MNIIDAASFLHTIWPRELLRYENLELRAIRREDKTIKREFLPSVEQFLEAANKYGPGWDIYYGVSTRFQAGGKKKDCYRICTVWVDLDKKELPNFGFVKPDLIVNSGGGHHIYWLLDRPIFIRTGRWKEIEAINRSLAKKFGGDVMAIDVARILRVPGFSNHKYKPPTKVKAYAILDK